MLHITAAISLLCITSPVDRAGRIEAHPRETGQATNYRLTADATFDWKIGIVAGDIDLNGHTLLMDTGGGNVTRFTGAITGHGHLRWIGGGSDVWQTRPSFLQGEKPNTFTGTLTIERGTLALAKPPKIPAFSGKLLILGGGANQAIVALHNPHQLPDDCTVRITGKHEGRIWTQGHSETVGQLDLQSHGSIDLGDGNSHLAFADSSSLKWDLEKTLTIDRWTQGKDKITFGHNGDGVAAGQLARIGFADPSDLPAGLYAAKLTDKGELVPGERVSAKNPPFDVSDDAREARRALYESSGCKDIGGKDSPLRDGMTISFFGDSITWQNAYISRIGRAIAQGESTKGRKINLINRGINGGGVLSIRDGSEKAAYVSPQNQDGPQAPFAQVIAKDKADVAVVLIGINDVWWRNTSPEDFEKAMHDLVEAAKKNKTRLILATLTSIGEMPDGTNPKDKACDQFAQLTRKVAEETGATLVDLRTVFKAYLQNHNARLRVDGSLVMRNAGVLTYDGVHPSDAGNDLIADHLAAGIVQALKASN